MIIYKAPVDVQKWMSKKATVLIISYDTFSALRKKSLDAGLKTAGSEPTGKVMLLCCTSGYMDKSMSSCCASVEANSN